MADLDPILLCRACIEWQQAPYGTKDHVVGQWAKVFGVSEQTLYRMFKNSGFLPNQRKERATKGIPLIDRLDEHVRAIAYMYALLPKGARRPSLELVIEKAILNGVLPPEAAEISVSTYHRRLRELKLTDEEGRLLRFEGRRPMEMVQYDVSGSEYLYVAGFKDGEPVLRARASKGYKNKDKHENLRLWYHGMIDDCSRYWIARAYVSPGESSADALQFCRYAFCTKEDERIVFRGLPDTLYMDNGPLAKAEAAREFFDRIRVLIKTHEPESPSDTGKIEARWKHVWPAYESVSFLMDPDWAAKEYKLSEINGTLTEYMLRLNKKRHPNPSRRATREEIWLTVLHDGGVVDIPPEAFDSAFRRYRRQVKPDGTFSLDSETYAVKGLYDAWVYVYRGFPDNRRMVAEDILTHKRYDVEPFEMPGLDEIKKDKALPGKVIREEAKPKIKEALNGRPMKGLYEEPAPATNIKTFPVRSKGERAVPDPFDTSVYASIEEAMAEVYGIVGAGSLTEEEREAVSGLVIKNGLNKAYTVDLALDLRKGTEGAEEAGIEKDGKLI